MPDLKIRAKKIISFLLDLVFPPVCLACSFYLKTAGEQDRLLCEKCLQKIVVLDALLCPVCSRRLPIIQGNFPARPPCHKSSPFILASAASYENSAVRGLIHTLKYGRVKTALSPLIEFVLCPYLKTAGISRVITKECLIIPIPLHPKKERERGFNQSLLIAEALRDFLGDSPPLISRALVRVKNTKAQAEIKETSKREKNIKNCFAVKNPSPLWACPAKRRDKPFRKGRINSSGIKGRDVILVDDVFTSGATISEAVRILKAAGARRVLVFVLAKA